MLIFPSPSVIYVPISFPFLYNLNFAPCKYVIASCCVPSSPSVTDVTLLIFDISKSYVGIFSSSISIFAIGILSSSTTFTFLAPPSIIFNT